LKDRLHHEWLSNTDKWHVMLCDQGLTEQIGNCFVSAVGDPFLCFCQQRLVSAKPRV